MLTINRWFLLLLAFFASSCVTTFQQSGFVKPNHKINFDVLQTGDIIITPVNVTNPITWFGHSAIMVSKNNIGEYPKFMSGYVETDVKSWLKSKKQYVVLRYKHLNSIFKKKLIDNISFTRDKSYGITHKKDNQQFYCSQYIWYLFWKSAKDLGVSLDLSKQQDYLVLPYDFLESNQLIQVNIH